MIEENGYQVRYWDQISDEIGESIASDWDPKRLHKTLISKGFNVERKTLEKCIKKIDEENETFVVLKSHTKGPIDLDTFMNDLFTIDDGEQ